jgi:dCMP deaminase
MTSPFEFMQQAVDIVQTSLHETNKIAATLVGRSPDGMSFAVARTNFWPEPIRKAFPGGQRIGNASGTVHAELACVLAAPCSQDSVLYVTDPPCPNCVKNMAEAGIKTLYIDHKGFDKDFAQRRQGDFTDMSLRICEKAGISVNRIFRKDRRIEPILEIPHGYSPALEKPPRIDQIDAEPSPQLFETLVQEQQQLFKDRPFACALSRGPLGRVFLIGAEIHPVIGYTTATLEEPEGKYSFLLQPTNRVLMTAVRYGQKLQDGYLYSSRVPTSRELVNLVGSGLSRIAIGDRSQARDGFGLEALEALEKAGVLNAG